MDREEGAPEMSARQLNLLDHALRQLEKEIVSETRKVELSGEVINVDDPKYVDFWARVHGYQERCILLTEKTYREIELELGRRSGQLMRFRRGNPKQPRQGKGAREQEQDRIRSLKDRLARSRRLAEDVLRAYQDLVRAGTRPTGKDEAEAIAQMIQDLDKLAQQLQGKPITIQPGDGGPQIGPPPQGPMGPSALLLIAWTLIKAREYLQRRGKKDEDDDSVG
jgi:hypothetical protein